MRPPETRYVDRDGSALAYQVYGSGDAQILYTLETAQHMGLMWADPELNGVAERLARSARVAIVQRRGFGLSDSIDYVPTLEQQAEDLLAVMDDAGLGRATVVATWAMTGAAAMLAVDHPDRVGGLVLVEPVARLPRPGKVPEGWSPEAAKEWIEAVDDMLDHWGEGKVLRLWNSMVDTRLNRVLIGLMERSSATPAAVRAQFEWVSSIDFSEVLAAVQAATVVLHQPECPLPETAVRQVADLIPGATFQLLPPTKRGASPGGSMAAVNVFVREIATAAPAPVDLDRFVGTVLFTDIVGSTELIARLGDQRYAELQTDHLHLVQLAADDHGGRMLGAAGDGTLSLFPGPREALTAAERIRGEAHAAGFEVRSGLHTGELQRVGLDVAGMSVHVGARVMEAAGAGEIVVSRTVRDLLLGSGVEFASWGHHRLKGVPGSWELFALVRAGDQDNTAPAGRSAQTRLDRAVQWGVHRFPSVARVAARAAGGVERRRVRLAQPR